MERSFTTLDATSSFLNTKTPFPMRSMDALGCLPKCCGSYAADGIGMYEWGVDLAEGRQIIAFDIRDFERQVVVGKDLLEVYRKEAARVHEVEEQLFDGNRSAYRTSDRSIKRDIDKILDVIIEETTVPLVFGTREGTPWHLYRAISQREGELGELYILPLGGDDEVQFASHWQLPTHRATESVVPPQNLTCEANTRHEATAVSLALTFGSYRNLISLISWQHSACSVSGTIEQLWKPASRLGENGLQQIAETLFKRDDDRRNENNKLGLAFQE